MQPDRPSSNQKGVALVVALLFLLVVTLLTVTAARDSAFSLKMSGNLQDQYDSLQAAEATALATMALYDTGGDDPFDGSDTANPFAGITAHPLEQHLADLNDIGASVILTHLEEACPRATSERDTWDGGIGEGPKCDRYRIDAQHNKPERARTRVSLGVIRRLPVEP